MEESIEEIDFISQGLENFEIEEAPKTEVHHDPEKLPEELTEELPVDRRLISEQTILKESSAPIKASFETLGFILKRFQAGLEILFIYRHYIVDTPILPLI